MINSRAKQDVKIDELLIKYKKINNINVRLDKLKIDYELGKISFNEFEILKKRLSN
jgi:hypothetical protein